MKILCLFVLILSILCPEAEALEYSFNPFARVRHESASNYDLDSSQGDYKSFTGSRFWLAFNATHNNYEFYFQPQLGRSWGLDELGNSISGTTTDPYLSIHQVYAILPLFQSESLRLKMGRQELSYGDDLVLGSVIWSNVGRSFDAARITWRMGSSHLDLFSAKLSEKNATTPSNGDKDLHGIYFSSKNDFEFFKDIDVYVLNYNDSTTVPHNDFTAYGIRVAGNYASLFHRFEFTFEDQNSSEYQLDGELGYDGGVYGRLSVNYFEATDNYNQLFPTAHKWLGIADVVSRRNIKGYQLKHDLKWNESFSHSISYHRFLRSSTSQTAFKFSGAALGGTTNSDDHIGDEFDLIFNYKEDQNLSYQLGGAYFNPGEYLNASGLVDDALFWYLQITLVF